MQFLKKIFDKVRTSTMSKTSVDHFAVLGLSLSSSECEAEVDLVLIQTSFVFLWKKYLCMKNTS